MQFCNFFINLFVIQPSKCVNPPPRQWKKFFSAISRKRISDNSRKHVMSSPITWMEIKQRQFNYNPRHDSVQLKPRYFDYIPRHNSTELKPGHFDYNPQHDSVELKPRYIDYNPRHDSVELKLRHFDYRPRHDSVELKLNYRA